MVLLGAVAVVLIDLSERRQQERSRALEYVSGFLGGESGTALLAHPLSVTAWRLHAVGGRVIVPEVQALRALVGVLEEPATYARDVPLSERAYDLSLRFEDEHGSMNLLFTDDGAACQVLRDGSRISQASTAPASGRVRQLLAQLGPGLAPPGAR